MAISNRRGFTLLELLIVIVIIGILAAIAIPQFIHVENKRTCRNVVLAIVKAEEYYFLKKGFYTADWFSLDLSDETKKLLNTNGLSVMIQQSPMNPRSYKVTATKGRVKVTGDESGSIEVKKE